MAAPAAQFRQSLSAPGLIRNLRETFSQVHDKRRAKSVLHTMPDSLMAAFAMFNLKYPSMLRFDTEAHGDPRLIHNLKSLFGLNKVPSDTQMRKILDPVKPEALRPAFEALHHELQRGKVFSNSRPVPYIERISPTVFYKQAQLFRRTVGTERVTRVIRCESELSVPMVQGKNWIVTPK